MASTRELWAAAYRLYQEHAAALEAAPQDQTSAIFEKLAKECLDLSRGNGREGQLLSRAVYEMLAARAEDQRAGEEKQKSSSESRHFPPG